LSLLGLLLLRNNQVAAAEETASRAITLLPENSKQVIVYQCHQVLGEIYRVKDNYKEAIDHFKEALGIASPHNWHSEAFWIHHSLVVLFAEEARFDDANAHLDQARLHAANNAKNLVYAMMLQAHIFHHQRRFREAISAAALAAEAFEKIGATVHAEMCRKLYGIVGTNQLLVGPDVSNLDGECRILINASICRALY
jgi:tetratricopeptide (TPR) repeat protein